MKTLFISIFCIVCSFTCKAQIFTSVELENYKFRVKQISEFMERFNGKLSIVEKSDSNWRKKNLILLFDRDAYMKDSKGAELFVSKIIDDSITLNYNDTTWLAEAECNATLNGKDTKITLYLAVECIKGDMYKWVIKGAEGIPLQLKPNKVNGGLKISPVDNELNFMQLSHITSVEARNIINYKSKDTEVDPLQVFYTLVYEKKLAIKNVQKLKYHFNLKKLSFVVSFFERDNMNAGWLISDYNIYE